jgi:hypothetical protein
VPDRAAVLASPVQYLVVGVHVAAGKRLAFPAKFKKAADVKAKPLFAIISHVEMELVGQGQDQKQKPVLYFEDDEKPMVLNRTNFEALEDAFGDSDDWPGHKVKIKCERTKFQGKTVDGLRIDPIVTKPAAKDDFSDPAPGLLCCAGLCCTMWPHERGGATIMGKRPQNGPTFTKAPPKKRPPMTDDERVAWQARKDAELEDTKRTAAKTRNLHQLIHKDPKPALRELGLLKKN